MPLKKYTDFDNDIKIDTKAQIKKSSHQKKMINEDILLASKNNISNNMEIEILEETIIKFNSGTLNDIMETLKTKYSDTDYFLRKKDNELHIVKYNENITLNTNEFVNGLLKYYSSKPELKKIIEGIKVKGNDKFCIIENMKQKYDEKFTNDITNLLFKKSKS